MQKIFFISNNSQKVSAGVQAPHLDRFQRVEQLNEMLSRGWSLKARAQIRISCSKRKLDVTC